jgi:hypothetical protein
MSYGGLRGQLVQDLRDEAAAVALHEVVFGYEALVNEEDVDAGPV